MDLRQIFTAFKYPNYRLWFFGQLISLFGTWMQTTAQSYLVFELTKSPAYLGFISFAFGVPAWIFMLYGGVIADRVARRTLLMTTQISMMCLAFFLAALTFSGIVQPWHILILAFCLGTANAFDAPARQSFILEMVDREDLTNAIALNSTLFNLSAAVGPAVAGVIYMMMGPAWCFTLNAVSFIAVIIALYMMKVKPQPAVVQSVSALSSLREGLRYVFLNTHILALIIIVAITTLFGFSFNTLIPAWAVTILGGNAATNGLLQSARGFGALLSALFLASLGRFQYKGKLLTGGTFAFPIILLFFAIVRWLPLSLLMLFCLGIAFLLVMNLSNALLQIVVPDHLRGRVMSIYSLTLFGLMPIGGLLAGIIAEWAGEPETIILSAILCFICSVMVRIFAPKVYRLN